MKNIEQPHPSETLKEKLFNLKISPENFLKEIMEIDQRTPERKDAVKNLEILEDQEVKKVIRLQNDPNLTRVYSNLLSVTNFHIAQQEIMENNNPQSAKEYFKKSLEYLKEKIKKSKEPNQWELYIKGTIAYFDKDIKSLEDVLEKIDKGVNKDIIKSFIKGLKTRGDLDYLEDYSNR